MHLLHENGCIQNWKTEELKPKKMDSNCRATWKKQNNIVSQQIIKNTYVRYSKYQLDHKHHRRNWFGILHCRIYLSRNRHTPNFHLDFLQVRSKFCVLETNYAIHFTNNWFNLERNPRERNTILKDWRKNCQGFFPFLSARLASLRQFDFFFL